MFLETYQLAKAAEDSIVRNLELKKKKKVDTVKRVRDVDGNSIPTVVTYLVR